MLTAAPSAEVTATDLNEAMLALGSPRVPGAMWRQADAQRLPFPNGGFDLVVCQFGVMFIPDRIQAFTEVRRVPAPGGRSGYLTGTPVLAAVEERSDGPAVRATVVEEMAARPGPGPVTAPMTAYVFRAAA